jgi:hypothetical protein
MKLVFKNHKAMEESHASKNWSIICRWFEETVVLQEEENCDYQNGSTPTMQT